MNYHATKAKTPRIQAIVAACHKRRKNVRKFTYTHKGVPVHYRTKEP